MAFLDYQNAILIEISHRRAFYALIVSFFSCLAISLISFFLCIFLPREFLTSIFGKDVVPFFWVIPVTVFISSINTLFYSWFLRKGKFTLISKNKVIIAIISVFVQISLGLLKVGTLGFIVANLISFSISSVLFGIVFFNSIEFTFAKVNLMVLIDICKKYKNFPLFSVWSNSLNIITLQIPQFLLNSFFGSSLVGQLSLANRMINLPISFISTSFQDLFRQSSAKENSETGKSKNTYLRFLRIGIVFGVLLLVICLFVIPPLFAFIFGPKWVTAGVYVKILAPLTVIRFVIGPLSYMFYIKLKQKLDLLWQIGLFVLTISILYGGYHWLGIQNESDLLISYTLVISVWYIINGLISYRLANLTNTKIN
jgi:O-antigen/teichoic acid export membrane protein